MNFKRCLGAVWVASAQPPTWDKSLPTGPWASIVASDWSHSTFFGPVYQLCNFVTRNLREVFKSEDRHSHSEIALTNIRKVNIYLELSFYLTQKFMNLLSHFWKRPFWIIQTFGNCGLNAIELKDFKALWNWKYLNSSALIQLKLKEFARIL